MAADREAAAVSTPGPFAPGSTDDARLKRIRALAKMLDNAYEVPGTGWRFGWDALVGLVPGGGDVATGLLSLYVVIEAIRLRLPKKLLWKMVGNVTLDAVSGTMPFIGDLFDLTYRANYRNLKLVEEYLDPSVKVQPLPASSAPTVEPWSPSERIARWVLIGSLLPLCWLAMQIVHELGHVFAALGTGGGVTALVFHPFAISRTDVLPNPHPLIVTWAGPIFGALAPVALWLVVKWLGWRSAYLFRFFAAFCLVANGVYIGMAILRPVGDAEMLVRAGVPTWLLLILGLFAARSGFALWQKQGSYFGIGAGAPPVLPRHAWATAWLLAALVAGGFYWTAKTGFL